MILLGWLGWSQPGLGESLVITEDYRVMLSDEFIRRQERNGGYSLRAFAKSLGVSITTLSEVLSGKRRLSRRSAAKILENLDWQDPQRRGFLLSALGVSTPAEVLQPSDDRFELLELDQFRVIADWYHLAILSLAKLPTNRSDPHWVASRLGLTYAVAKAAMQRLVRMGVIRCEEGRLVRTSQPLFVKPSSQDAAVRRYHRQNLEKATESLSVTPTESRDISAITLPFDPAKMQQARDLIQQFREKFSELMETSDTREVYTLAIQLFPVTQGSETEE